MIPQIQFIKGVRENTLPIVKLTRSKNGQTGTATFVFIYPEIFFSKKIYRGHIYYPLQASRPKTSLKINKTIGYTIGLIGIGSRNFSATQIKFKAKGVCYLFSYKYIVAKVYIPVRKIGITTGKGNGGHAAQISTYRPSSVRFMAFK
jgi:hypothetical protein